MNVGSDRSGSDVFAGNARETGKFVLGTAQLGLPYGIASEHAPLRHESIEIIQHAIDHGVYCLDTANAYGSSEGIIGEALATLPNQGCLVVTKLNPLSEVDADAGEDVAIKIAECSLIKSQQALRQAVLDTVLFHRSAHIKQWNGAVFDLMKEWQATGRLKSIGVSVQSVDELASVLDITEISHIQLPYNMLDPRWDAVIRRIRTVRKHRRLTIHIRSIFLQGLLLTSRHSLWARAHVEDPTPIMHWLNTLCQINARADIAGLCIAWARALDWVNGIVIGCDNLCQLKLNLQGFKEDALTQEMIELIRTTRPILPEKTLNPSMWAN